MATKITAEKALILLRKAHVVCNKTVLPQICQTLDRKSVQLIIPFDDATNLCIGVDAANQLLKETRMGGIAMAELFDNLHRDLKQAERANACLETLVSDLIAEKAIMLASMKMLVGKSDNGGG